MVYSRKKPRTANKYVRKSKYYRRKNYKKKAFVKKVEKICVNKIQQEAEKKTAFSSSNNWENLRPITDPGNFQIDNIKVLTPDDASLVQSTINIPQSAFGESDERIGNKIKTFSAYMTLMVRPQSQFDLTTNYNPMPLYVRMYIVKLRPHLEDTVANLMSVLQNSFFENGGDSLGFTGTIIDFTKFINKVQIDVVKTRTFKLGLSNYPSGFNVGNPNNANQAFQNNDFKLMYKSQINLTKVMNKNFYFNDGTNTTVQRRLYMFFVPFRIDGNVFTTQAGSQVGCIPALYSYNYLYKFTDY